MVLHIAKSIVKKTATADNQKSHEEISLWLFYFVGK